MSEFNNYGAEGPVIKSAFAKPLPPEPKQEVAPIQQQMPESQFGVVMSEDGTPVPVQANIVEPGESSHPFMDKYTRPVKKSPRKIVGRKDEMARLEACLNRPELCNAILLAEAGTGKTMLVQGLMAKDSSRVYLEINLAKMIADFDPLTLGNALTSLFDEVKIKRQEIGKEVVLFIDEFHQIVQLSAAAVEAMKPLLADSGTRGIKFIAATTNVEFQKFISPNQPLVERLQRINLPQPGKNMTIAILKGMAEQYGVSTQFYNDSIYEAIYENTNRYIPANSQPRKSILILDSMVGWHRATGRPMDKKLLADVIYESEGINITFNVDATKIKENLDAHVYAQELASTLVSNRLQIAVADLNDKSKPMASFLFTGSTGVGKSNICSTIIPVFTEDGSVTHKKAGDIKVGDYLFDREGKPTKVLGVFPQGKRQVYRVTLGDGRTLDVSDNHLWSVFPAKRARDEGYTIYETKTLVNKGLSTRHHDRVAMKYFIPMNQPVQWVARDYKVDPYVVGAMIGNGCLTNETLEISSNDEYVVSKISNLIGAASYKRDISNYSWFFYTGNIVNNKNERIHRDSLFADMPEICNKKSTERRIPADYMTGSVEQRWALINGLFDTDGTCCGSDGERYNVSYSTYSKDLAYDIQELLYSLGISSTVSAHNREGKNTEYDVSVHVSGEVKPKFFTLPRKREIAEKAVGVNKQRNKTFDYVGIRSIDVLDKEEDMVCFYVDNDEHLYQAGQYIVTHNTEMTKQLASILFGDNSRDDGDENQSSNRNLIRFDMTEFANKESFERFRHELTFKIWEHPFSVVLLDEIEKACAEVTRLLLQVLDDGRLTDENNRQVVFTNCYIILTTNAGSEIYKTIAQYNASDTGDGSTLKRYNKLIRQSISSTTGDNRFPPELLGRIDAIVPFQPLSEATMRKIVGNKLLKLIKDVSKKHGVELRIDKHVIDYLVLDNLDTDSNSGGARIVVTKLTEEVVTPVAKYINENPSVKVVGVTVAGDMAWEHKDMLESTAYIKVAATS